MPKNGKMKELSDQLPKQKYEQKKEKKTHDILEKDKSKNLLDDMLRNRSYLANRSQVPNNSLWLGFPATAPQR